MDTVPINQFNDIVPKLLDLTLGISPQIAQAYLSSFWLWFQIVSGILAFIFGALLIFLEFRFSQFHRIEREKEEAKKREATLKKAKQESAPSGAQGIKRWERIDTHINSSNQGEWRLAILEADILLEELLEHLGYSGQTIGDRLKSVEPGDIKTLDAAWEAHKIRNAIAHEGSDFTISEREARRVISLFESVFREFDFI